MAALAEALRQENADGRTIAPFEIVPCMEPYQGDPHERMPVTETDEEVTVPCRRAPLNVPDNQLRYLSIGYLLCPQ
jgi:hypothetical protein